MPTLPTLPLVSDYTTLSKLVDEIATQNKADYRQVLASGLTVLAKGWGEYLSRREFCSGEIIVSDLIGDHILLY